MRAQAGAWARGQGRKIGWRVRRGGSAMRGESRHGENHDGGASCHDGGQQPIGALGAAKAFESQ